MCNPLRPQLIFQNHLAVVINTFELWIILKKQLLSINVTTLITICYICWLHKITALQNSSQHLQPCWNIKHLMPSKGSDTRHRVPTLLLTEKSRTFPGPPWEIFQDLFGAHECLNIKKKTYNVQSVVHCRKFSTKQNVLHYCCLFSIWTTRKMHDFQGYFSRTFQDLKL